MSIAAQAVGPFTPSTPTMNLASLTSAASPLTQKGSIVGTFQYMAPELLQGAEADARSDLFSFGCVLYEMVTGRRAFEGKSQLSVFSSILEKDPEPISASQPLAPPMLDRVVRACLAKDPADRIQSAHDVAMDLRWVGESALRRIRKAAPRSSRNHGQLGRRRFWSLSSPWLDSPDIAGRNLPQTPSHFMPKSRRRTNFLWTPPATPAACPCLSPQGDKLAFVAHSGETKMLWVRALNSDTAQQLEGTQNAMHPFWSPDGRYIGFFANGKLAKIAATGGPVAVLADAPNSRGGSWSANDVIVFAPDFLGGLSKVSAQGGAVEPATLIEKTKHDTHRWPWFLPDGKHFLFLATSHTGGDPTPNGIYFGSVDSQVDSPDREPAIPRRNMLPAICSIAANTALVAQPFDPQSGTLSGSAVPLFNNLRDDVGVWRSIFAVSQNGLMVYQLGNAASAKSKLVWFDRSGKALADFDPR